MFAKLKSILGKRSKILKVMIGLILTPMELTLPNIRKLHQNGLVILWAFLGSIMWMAILAYLLIWWVVVIGDTFNITPEVNKSESTS